MRRPRRAALLFLLAVGAACDRGGPVEPPEPTLRLVPEVLDLRVGDVGQLTAEVTGIEDPALVFLSSNNAVAVSSPTGLVTALGAGSATITATVEGFPGLSAAALVRVSAGPPADSVQVTISPSAVFVSQGDSVRLTASVEGIAAQAVQWRSVDPAVATVGPEGVVTGLSQGTAVILAFSSAVPQAVGTATVRVLAPAPISVTIAPAAAAIQVDSPLQLSATVAGSGDQSVTWTSLDTAVARVSPTGVVTGVAPGAAAVRATSVAHPGAAATAGITVGAVGLVVDPGAAEMDLGDTLQMRARVVGLADTTVTWESGNPSVASVGPATGSVTALAPGTALITARANGAPQARSAAVVTVRAPSQGGLSIASVAAVDPETGERTEAPVTALSGLIEVTANLPDESSGTAMKLVVDGSVVRSRPLPDASADTAALLLLTSAFDPVSGAPAFLNGAHTLAVWLVDAADQVVAVASLPVAFQNPDGFALGVRAPGPSAVNPATGELWVTGDIGVQAVPVIYSGSYVIARVRAGLCRAGDGAVLTSGVDATREDGFDVVFEADTPPSTTGSEGGANGIEELAEACIASSQTSGGAVGPTLILNGRRDLWPDGAPARLRVDNRAPVIPARFTLDPTQTAVWITPDFEFTRATTGLGASDAVIDGGVNDVSCVFHAGPSYQDLMPVTRGGDLPESATNTAYVAQVVCTDALGNAGSRNLSDGQGNPQTFGVDYP